ncbi:MAG: dynamin family protein [Frankiaceae bacterium]|nr:dynamin family protein [Frankiaceae bacterium]
MSTALEQALDLCDRAVSLAPSRATEIGVVRQRAQGPLRVALAGRVKAGKSTLLNALVGERLAATDAGECTRIVTWFQDGSGYDVQALLSDGSRVAIPFRRVDGALQLQLDGLDADQVTRLEVTWPSARLRSITLIDTPGLASLDDRNSLRTREFLAMGEDRPADADAVIYLMRHLHRADAEFLGAFLDRSVSASSPVNAVAVLARADEIGACRLDAMTSAARIASRYQADPVLRSLCTHVTAMAGLLAETGLTLREDEANALRTLAQTPSAELDAMLLSVDAFCEPASSELTVEMRRALLERLGLYGLRLVVQELVAARAGTATELSRVLLAASGLDALRALIDGHFLPRAQTLKARSALAALRDVARSLAADDPAGARALDAEIERVEAAIPDFAELRTTHLVLSGAVILSAAETAEVELACTPGATDSTRLGIDEGSTAEVRRQAALLAVGRWRTRASDPLNDSATNEVCETMARTFEGIYAAAV